MKINSLNIFVLIEKIKIWKLALIVSVLMCSTVLYAHYPVDYGSELKGMSGTGTLSSFGATSLMYNPSSLGFNLGIKDSRVGYWNDEQEEGLGLDFSYEQSLSYILLEYKHPDYSGLKFHLVVPPVSFGFRLSGSSWNLGLLVVPLGVNSKQTIDKVPFDLDYHVPTLVDFTTQRTAANLFLGGSIRLEKVSLGTSVDFLYDKEKQNIVLTESEKENLWITKKGKFLGYTLGLRYDSDSFGVGVKYKGKSTRKYDVSRGATDGVKAIVNFNSDAPAPVNFLPHRFGIGLYKVLSSVILNLEYEFEEYKRGRTVYRRGLGTDEPAEIAYKNVHGASISSVIKLNEEYVLTGGISYFTGNMDEGKFKDEDSGRQGISCGNIEAIPHWGLGVGVGRKVFDSLLDVQSGFRYVFGQKSVAGNVPGEGTYKFRMVMVTFRVSY